MTIGKRYTHSFFKLSQKLWNYRKCIGHGKIYRDRTSHFELVVPKAFKAGILHPKEEKRANNQQHKAPSPLTVTVNSKHDNQNML